MECLREQFEDGVVLGGRYKTIAPLNHGSFGMVFMARDLQTSDTVAIKCLTKKSSANEAVVDFAIDDKSEELVLHSRLGQHPNIVNLLDHFETDAHVYIVLEFCPRGDLYEAIRNDHGPLETEHVRCFMLELVDAVEYIHAKGIYHRDIKPENIFLTQAGSMKLGDFGLSTTEAWSFETTVGSDRYMSPEQYDSAGAGYSPAQADIWAIGICLLNILFSRNPFTAPTEDDPLFLDFSRDKQSLFDVFPSMSQDTYEVIVQCMNLDPRKRSLEGARSALDRVVSFTTLDEALDDFCSAERRTIASANREPLRTPSISSPPVENGAFPWAKALQTSPQAVRQLSVIPDDESYTEELFPKSEVNTDWCSAIAGETPSVDSVLTSSLANSMHSLAIGRPQLQRSSDGVSSMAGSLPISMSKPRKQPAMSLVFGRKDAMSKSWSDMWDEDEEEEEEQRSRQLQNLKELNSRTWSHESIAAEDDDTPRAGQSPATKSIASSVKADVSTIEHAISNALDDDFGTGGFMFEEHKPASPQAPRYSPPSKRSPLVSPIDKWAVLGERRRAINEAPVTPSKSATSMKHIGRPFGNSGEVGFSSYGHGVWDHFNTAAQQSGSNINLPSFATPTKEGYANKRVPSKERARACPWNEGRSPNFNWRKEKRHDFGDFEWVGALAGGAQT